MSDTLPKARRRRQVQYNWSPTAIRALREYMNLTQREMADELEVRQQTISEWETDAHRTRVGGLPTDFWSVPVGFGA